MRLVRLFLLLVLFAPTACTDDGSGADEEWGMEGPLEPLPPPGKEDSEYRKGLAVGTDTSRTQVWTAKNKWEDTDTPAARAAGIAWPENSGLTWDQKYQKWVESLKWIPGVDGYSETIELTTPWGKTLPAPILECAEVAIFQRITFAAWYQLPLQFEAQDSRGQRIYFGHYGVRTANGRYAETPEFALVYKDHTNSSDWQTTWPKDAALRKRKLWGGTDNQIELGEGEVFGAYADEIHLNKRAAHFTVLALNYLYSANVADTANTYNIVPDAVAAGDILIERWQRNGIGHTLLVKEVQQIGEGNLDVATASGSMPRRQPKRESGVASKNYFTSNYSGGVGMASDGTPYAKLGGGLKRWRVTKNVNGFWTNTWMAADEAHWINSTDFERISARPARFESLLGQVSPAQQKAQLLQVIEDARMHLSKYPASCAARERRENAFRALYDLGERDLGETKLQIDSAHRKLDDYVLAELEYTKSKTCCWNSTTMAMSEIIMSKARAEQEAAGSCVTPTVFKSRTDGYSVWATHASELGRGADWRNWTEDEACSQRDVAQDTEAPLSATPFCSLQ